VSLRSFRELLKEWLPLGKRPGPYEVLAWLGRAAIIKAAKKRWAKVRKQAKKVTG
jgi:hypothetical protein